MDGNAQEPIFGGGGAEGDSGVGDIDVAIVERWCRVGGVFLGEFAEFGHAGFSLAEAVAQRCRNPAGPGGSGHIDHLEAGGALADHLGPDGSAVFDGDFG